MNDDRTIEHVLDNETSGLISASKFFSQAENEIFKLRRLAEEGIQGLREHKFLCLYCKQPVKIRGGIYLKNFETVQKLHFAHLKDSNECHIKTSLNRSKEYILCVTYNGVKESREHIEAKKMIAHYLNLNSQYKKEVSDVAVEAVYKGERVSGSWRKPDIRFQYKYNKYVIEIQLSATFLNVIAQRENFYKQENVFILWVFKEFSTEIHAQLFTEKDILYANKQNAFVFDDEAILLSEQRKELVLHCYYIQWERVKDTMEKKWGDEFISLAELQKDDKEYKVFYYDSDAEQEKLKKEIEGEITKKLEKDNQLREYQRQFEERQLKNETTRQEIKHSLIFYPFAKSQLIDIFKRHSPQIDHELFTLIGQGYLIGPEDKKFLVDQFGLSRKKIEDPEWRFYCGKIAMMLFYFKNMEKDMAIYYLKIERILYAILSLKCGQVIGYNYRSLSLILHEIVDRRKPFFELTLRAADWYKRTQEIFDADKSFKLRQKINTLRLENPQQNNQYDNAFKKIFPELFPESS